MQERTRYENRILALLATQGIRERPSLRTWERDLATLQTGDGRALPKLRSAEINRLRRRLVLTMELIRELDAERTAALDAAPDDAACQKITALCRIRGIGENFAAVLGAGWHSSPNLALPDNIALLPLPTYSPGSCPRHGVGVSVLVSVRG